MTDLRDHDQSGQKSYNKNYGSITIQNPAKLGRAQPQPLNLRLTHPRDHLRTENSALHMEKH